MYKTHHLQARMRQRGISQTMLETVQYFGTVYGDKTVLGRKEIGKALDLLDQCRRKGDKKGLDLLNQFEKTPKRKGNKKGLDLLDQRKKALLKVMDKGGVILVEQDGSGITTYNFSGLKN